FTSSIDQALAVMNGEFTNRISRVSEKSLLGRIFKEHRAADDRIKELYLALLFREPQAAELQRALEFVNSGGPTQRNFEDLMFALLMTTEFATNH
ncbi:MAG: DUF1553 domain-containing protein, partial [Planctomycetaceae bacterium]|nr:DUF1553 domain-containing protein [Planctomycetaceae bacterium]